MNQIKCYSTFIAQSIPHDVEVHDYSNQQIRRISYRFIPLQAEWHVGWGSKTISWKNTYFANSNNFFSHQNGIPHKEKVFMSKQKRMQYCIPLQHSVNKK